MKKIKKEEYTKLNKALYDLEDILASMGVKEFSLSRDRHNLQIDTDTDGIDSDLLYAFCDDIARMHDVAIGHKAVRKAA